VLSWNVRDLLGDPLTVARVIRDARPDVLCLQEGPRRPGASWRLAALARATGLSVTSGGRTSAGTAILVSARIRTADARAFALPVTGRLTRPRGAVTATVATPGGTPVRVACVHLGLDADERARHVPAILRRLPADLPLVVAGDLNERPGAESWRAFGRRVSDPDPGAGPTYPSRDPRARIDAVLVGPGIGVLEYDRWRPDDKDVRRSSDHRPVLAVLTASSPAP
jgi:endonuclease/exonuclease/phosphatase family metal-dependent hydrolase